MLGCAKNPVTGKSELQLFSDNYEVQLGAQTRDALIKQYGVVKNEKLRLYVESVGKKLSQFSERKNLPYSFYILDTEMINAFAAPGGYIFMTKGILLYLDDEAAMAGVLGHEIGHIAARHGMIALEKKFGYQVLMEITQLLIKKDLGGLKPYSDFVTGMVLLGYGRENEFVADDCGLRYMTAAGYDPSSVREFFQKLQKLEGREPGKIEMLFRTHPSTTERIKKIDDFIAKGGYSGNKYLKNERVYKEYIGELR